KEGYTFSGWSELPDSMPAMDVTVEGSFTVNRYRLTYLLDSMEYSVDSIAYGTELVQKDSLFKEGYTFSGWSELPDSMPAMDVTVEGSFTVNRYRLTYLLDSMEYSVDSIAYGTELVQKDSLFKEGYTFSGWSELPDSMPARDVTVEGSFTVNRYRLTYLLDSMEYSVDSIAYGTELLQKDSLFKEGYTFSGWSELPDSMPARDVTVEGSFTVNHYTLLYIIDGEVYATEKVAYGENIMLKEVPSKEGYAFCGWSEVPATMPANDLTVTGTFTPLVYCDTPTISYSNGKLMFECTTDGAECVANIVSDDFLEHVGHEMELTLTYQVNVYAKAEGYANSEVVTATICWIECDHQSEAHETTAIPATVVLIQSSNGIISIQGLEEGTSVSVYTISGMEVANGVAEEDVVLILDTDLQKGEVAIVKMGTRTVKVVMK
ncbi:MAG: InlB B-repeat-containing protein, partial [Bacteroidaceae bacterium]|nr:InlB B-repeat-containing protein [Bacteroidaceae bacterium]